jgi:hypothetical protein
MNTPPCDLKKIDDVERELFRKYSIALRLWARRFNTAEIAAHLKEPEHIVCRWIWHWRELSRESMT